MQPVTRTTAAVALAIALIQTRAGAQTHEHPTLHVNPRWKECSFQLDAALTRPAWRQFTEEAGLVVYFRPLSDARPMGKGKVEVSMLQWQTGIDDSDSAWNDTFVHPDSTHYLFEGKGLAFPGLMLRAGVSEKTDVGVYFTKAIGANYGFYGGQVQRSLAGGASAKWDAAARVSYVAMFGPADVDFALYGADLLASRRFALTRWASLSPYAGVSTYLATSHEKSAVVDLPNEQVLGARGTIGAALQLSKARIGAEYSLAKVPSVSFKVGVGL